MSDGEKMVWAAAFVAYRREYRGSSITEAVEAGWVAVHDLRQCESQLRDGWGDHECVGLWEEMTR